MNSLRRYVFAALTVIVAAAPGVAAEYRFDLTHLLDSSGRCLGDCAFDLGTQFSRIDSAELQVSGVFEPGFHLRIGGVPGEISTGLIWEPFDNIEWGFWLGDANASGLGNITFGIDFEGISGPFEQRIIPAGVFTVPNDGALTDFLIQPAAPTDFAFLLDGAAKALALSFYTGLDSSDAPATPQFNQVTLILHGVIVPEPSAAVIGALLLVASAGLRPCRAFLR